MMLRVRPALLVAAVLALTVSACGGSEEPKKPATSAPATQQTQVPVPEGITLTEYGTDLDFGQSAYVAYAPGPNRATVLRLTVASATQGSIADLSGYSLEERTRASTPYYIRVAVENVGDGDVGKSPVPLFLVDNRNTLIAASSFTNSFTKCPSQPLPASFAPKDKANFCLVYLAPDHGTMTGVSFRDLQEYAPIEWKGDITVPQAPATKGGKGAKGGKNAGGASPTTGATP